MSANSITILVASDVSLSGEDFSKVNITGANISNGIFHKTDFSYANLTNVYARNCFFMETNFKGAVM